VDILDLLATLSRDPDVCADLDNEVSDRLWWFARLVHKYSGLAVADILEASQRLAGRETLEGADGLLAEYIGEARRDLSHVAERGHQLDAAGTTARLWRRLLREWPAFDEVWREARKRNTKAAGESAAPGSSAPPPAPQGRPKGRMTVEQANEKAMELAKTMKIVFFTLSQREQANRIGCSWATWSKTKFFREAKKKALAQQKASGRAPAPRTVTLTDNIEAVLANPTSEAAEQAIANEDAARAKKRWESSSPNRRWEDLSPEEQEREIAALDAEDEELQRLVDEQRAEQQADEGRMFRPRKRP
jgi:hypothetical protein